MASRGWKQWTAEEARRALEAWRSSGLSLRVYARRSGVTTTRLRWWRKRLGDWAAAAASSEVQLVPVIPTPVAAPRGAGATVLLPGRVVLELDVGCVPATWVAALVLELERAQ